MENTEKSFKYTYSAKEQDEIKRIRNKYENQEEDGIAKLRKLDAMVTQKATSVALCYGIVGSLILGIGMSLILSDLGTILGMSVMIKMVLGIFTGVIGLILIVLAYPMYNTTLKKEREKIAPEILKMSEELLL